MLQEYERIHALQANAHSLVQIKNLSSVHDGTSEFPIYGITIGRSDRVRPTLGLFAGVHGLERVGSEVVLSFLESLNEELKWDRDLQELFNHVRLVSIPVINPTGMARGWRSNYQGVDLMRNAPVKALEPVPFLVGGHHISAKLPYFRGHELQKEVQTVIRFVQEEMLSGSHSLSIDFHSGFGAQDRLWFPYAKTKAPFPHTSEAKRIEVLLRKTYPNHIYKVEPQSDSYITHGDVWDYLYDIQCKENPHSIYIPWTLEMGSWLWIRKNPSHLFRLRGVFDPIKPHRRSRIMRRHIPLISFFLKVCRNFDSWAAAA